MKKFLCFLILLAPLTIAQTFRIKRPVPDDVQINGSYLYGEPSIKGEPWAHRGVDIDVVYDTVYSVADGRIYFVGYEPDGCGNYMFIESRWNGRKVYFLYCHLSKFLKRAGESVKAGEPVAISGNTGFSTGPHLHFEIRMDTPDYSAERSRRNPELWFAISGMGAIYGRIDGAPDNTRVDIDPDPKPRPPYTTFSYALTYRFSDPAIGSDDIYNENYAIGDVKPGRYVITALGGLYRRVVTVKAGQVVNADESVGIYGESENYKFKLYQNYPNPFNYETFIKYEVGEVSHVKIKVYDVLGRLVRVLVDEVKAPGVYYVKFSASGLPTGIYFCSMTSGSFSDVKVMVFVK